MTSSSIDSKASSAPTKSNSDMTTKIAAYPFKQFEPYWQETWLRERLFTAHNPGDPDFEQERDQFYVLDMFPYPSGNGLHVGHLLGYTATDIVARYHRMCGDNVLHPMGWDAFGLPAEQYAIKTGEHPRKTTQRNIAQFKKQLQRVGFSYDWSREINTTDPEYFRWTQSIFLKLYHSWFNPETKKAESITTYLGEDRDAVRLAYVAEVPVNWCPKLGTVLANEEVVDGKSEVGGFPVERRPMRQWILRITAFAERLIEDLDLLDWPDSIKQLQRHWIGRSEGAQVTFQLESTAQKDTKNSKEGKNPQELTVFTTRVDTLYGVTYLVVAPEHPLVTSLEKIPKEYRQALRAYQEQCQRKSDLERTELSKEKTGVFSGLYAIHPLTEELLPIWVADYILMSYGSGAVMAVPAHDQRDYDFAMQFKLQIKQVITSSLLSEEKEKETIPLPYCGKEGVVINSPLCEGQEIGVAQSRLIEWLEQNCLGEAKVEYKLRDWLFSRQRYWGEPFPIIWQDGKHYPLGEEELPLKPPAMEDFQPTGTTEPPLSKAKEWLHYSAQATRELNTMPQWAGSCWYYLRYCDPHNNHVFIDKEVDRYWSGKGKSGMVDLYVGGTEHAVLHLLYARFWHKVLFDLGEVTTPEPFQKLLNQGMILGPDGQKMSKSRGNVVNPDEVIEKYGADALRLYEMFMGPLEHTKPWSVTGVEGVYRFLGRIWRLIVSEKIDETGSSSWQLSKKVSDQPLSPEQNRLLHATIKKVTEDIHDFSFNTALSQLMILVNELTKSDQVSTLALIPLLQLLHPFAPHITEQLWHCLRSSGKRLELIQSLEPFIMQSQWPSWEESFLKEKEVTYILQINGKVRAKAVTAASLEQAEVEKIAQQHPSLKNYLDPSQSHKKIKKVIFVPDRLLNFVLIDV